ncbi:MAG: IPT/TIG domain-containing protein [Fermentimonas sp.]|jgi:hypothetical protein
MSRKTTFLIKWVLLFSVALAYVSCKDSNEDGLTGIEYDPSKPVTLNTFYPDSGGIADKVIITGSNFGINPDIIRVYFNHKKAAVISSDGNRIYTLVPRMPGDECIVTVVVGNDSLTFEHTFQYQLSISVSTVAGNGSAEFVSGTLAESQLKPSHLGVDNEYNIFVAVRDNPYGVVRINEEENMVFPLSMNSTSSVMIPNSPAIDKKTGVITFPSETSIPAFVTCDPKEAWAPRFRNFHITKTNGYAPPTNSWKHSMAACELDGYVYTRFFEGQIIKIHPTTYEAEIIYQTPNGTTNGVTFHPLHPHLLYIAGRSGGMAGGVYSMDIRDPANTFKRLNAAGSGHRDGELEVALFNAPWQIYFDPEGYLYIADGGNHCIRRISPQNIVETVVGMPGTSGWKDGGPDEALFNTPRGVGVDKEGTVYIADWGNNRVRKLAIE